MKRSAQVSFEFLIITIFLLVTVSLAMYYLGFISLDVQRQQVKGEMDDLANSIIQEQNTFIKVDGGYTRDYLIYNHTYTRFNVTLTSGYLILQDLQIDPTGSKKYYYDLPGNYTPTLIKKNGNISIHFFKPYVQQTEYLHLG